MTDDLTEAARRGLQRASVHLMKAAIEVAEGISAFLEELGRDGDDAADTAEDAPEPTEVE